MFLGKSLSFLLFKRTLIRTSRQTQGKALKYISRPKGKNTAKVFEKQLLLQLSWRLAILKYSWPSVQLKK